MVQESLKDTTVCVVGLGYVGYPLADAFSRHLRTIGYDLDTKKIARINAEPGNNVIATTDPARIREADPPVSRYSTQTATLIPISVMVVTRVLATRVPPYGSSCCRVCLAPAETHSGHWKPTAALIMQSPQIGRPHRWQPM